MCGIFGAIVRDSNQLGDNKLTNLVNTLFVLSETRGKEAAGIAIRTDSSIEIYKDAKNAKSFVKTDKFKKVLKDSFEKVHTGNDIFSFIGHSRLVTNGAHSNNNNNQPLATNNQIAVHNGIITNESELWELNSDLKKETDLDTEILLKFFDKQFQKNKNIDESLKKTFSFIKGTASVASFIKDSPFLWLATNTGSIYFHSSKNNSVFIFASEKFILDKILSIKKLNKFFDNKKVHNLDAFKMMYF